jgi:DNA-binding NarL/FixJ family response regulator
MIKVFIIDDHHVVRRGLKQILSDEKDIEVVGEASSSEEFIEQPLIKPWDILVLDITMPGRNGLDALIEVKSKNPGSKILILSMHSDEEVVIRALRTGANGYLTKDSAPEELVKAIRQIYKGKKYIGTSITSKAMSDLTNGNGEEPHKKLSNREFQVFCLLASGNSLAKIADDLSISIKTVSTYRTRIMEKVNLKTNIELVHYALKYKLVIPL